MNKNDEMILAVPASSLFNMNTPEGIKNEINGSGTFRQRGPLETNEAYKQIIPYVVLTHKRHILRYRRPSSGGEDRLHGRYAVGFGGHVNESDVSIVGAKNSELFKAVLNAASREVSEEVSVYIPACDFKFTCDIYCPDDLVGRVHFGVGLTCELSDSQARAISHSDEVELLGWLTKEEIQLCSPTLEKWSRYVLFNTFGCP